MQTETKPAPRFRNLASSPWGAVQSRKQIADGIEWITTARHGGFRLSRDRWDAMTPHLKAISFTADEFFEEDCSYCAVILAFPEEFTDKQIASAARTYSRFYCDNPNAYRREEIGIPHLAPARVVCTNTL